MNRKWERAMLAKYKPIADANLFRIAKCTCGKTTLSEEKLAFFKSGAKATQSCAECGAHEEPHVNGKIIDHNFTPSVEMPVDEYYCGHSGWD